MSRKEATYLVENSEGQACVRFYRRKDWTLLTRDCPVAFEAAARLSRRTGLLVLAAFVLTFGSIISAFSGTPSDEDLRTADGTRLREIAPFKTILGLFEIPDARPSAPRQTMGQATLGKMKK
jgi:hypothetical protein